MLDRICLMMLVVGVACVSQSLSAAPIAVTSWSLTSTVYDGIGWQSATDTVVQFPLTESLTAQAGPLQTTSTYDFQSSGSGVVFRSDFQQQRGGTPPPGYRYTEGASSYVSIAFTALEDVHYDIGGLFTATGPTTDMNLYVFLNDASQNALFSSYQRGFVAPDNGYQVGGLEGSSINVLEGSMSGTLQAGRSYNFSALYQIYPSAPDAGATASGWSSFQVTPEPATGLGVLGMMGLAFLRRPKSR